MSGRTNFSKQAANLHVVKRLVQEKLSSELGGKSDTLHMIDERDVCPEMVEDLNGLLIGDKGYIRPELKNELKEHELYLQASLRKNMIDERPKKI